MNSYEVEFRKPDSGSSLDRYNVIADSLEGAIEQTKAEIPNEFGSEYKYELVSARETARAVLLPKRRTNARNKN